MWDSFRAVAKLATLYIGAIALVGGLAADIPGVEQHPIGGPVSGAAAAAFIFTLDILYEYPVGTALGFAFVCAVHWLFMLPKQVAMEREFDDVRNKRSSGRSRSGKVKRKNTAARRRK